MTFLTSPKNNRLLNKLLIVLTIPLVLSLILLIILYNRAVNFKHEIPALNLGIQEIKADNAELKDQIFTFFSTENLEHTKETQNLIQDKNPNYFKTKEQWEFASR